MNKILKQWIDALKTEKYTQCYGKYHAKDGSCCVLGVLENVLSDNGINRNRNESTIEFLVDNAGISHHKLLQLIGFNDDHKLSFKEFAKYIRTNFV
jgi:hypothetical protein